MRTYNEIMVNAEDMDADITGPATELQNIYGYSIQAVYTGATCDGTIKLQCSVDPVRNATPSPPQPATWTDIADSSYTITSSGSYVWNVENVMYTWVRVVFTDGSGGTNDGTLTLRINAKGV